MIPSMMKRRYKTGTARDQISMLPPRIENYVSENAPVRTIDAYVDILDLKALGFCVKAVSGAFRRRDCRRANAQPRQAGQPPSGAGVKMRPIFKARVAKIAKPIVHLLALKADSFDSARRSKHKVKTSLFLRNFSRLDHTRFQSIACMKGTSDRPIALRLVTRVPELSYMGK